MKLTIGEQLRVRLWRRNIKITELAEMMGQTRQNLTYKFSKNDFLESEKAEFEKVLDCQLDPGKLTAGEKLRILLLRRDWTIKYLAEKSGQTPQNLQNKIYRDDLSESELHKLADAMGFEYEPIFTDTATGEVY